MVKTKVWDPSEHLDSEEMNFAYINAALEDGDPALFAAALGDVARARGMTQIARLAGVSRESLYRALSTEGHPEFATVIKVLKALNLKFTVSADHPEEDPGEEERCLGEARLSA
ncbi:addiction module antidote protein [Sinorhizobium fredii]|uniref:addiction module antidote protein n=1 Tax=Rhizobium fredii TaxID=380 RepID=UPI000595681F|nr:addiction module antidote protein [Sinorhizobium fredii]WOS62175.1 putative addiction module antidote protein [Sinorhizobium fredii GR64]